MPDDVVEHRLGRQQQPPVEAHRARPGAARPARPLAADLKASSSRPRPARTPGRAGRRSRRGRRGGRSARAPAAGRRRRGPAARVRAGARACAPAATTSFSAAPRYGTESPRAATAARARSSSATRRSIHGAQLTDRGRCFAFRCPAREHDLDAAGRVDGDPDPPGAVRAPDRVVDLGCLRHAARGYGPAPTCPRFPELREPLTRWRRERPPRRRARHPRGPDRLPGRSVAAPADGAATAAERRRAGAARRARGGRPRRRAPAHADDRRAATTTPVAVRSTSTGSTGTTRGPSSGSGWLRSGEAAGLGARALGLVATWLLLDGGLERVRC